MLADLPSRHPVDMQLLRDFRKGRYFTLSIETRIEALLGHTAIFEPPFPRSIDRNHISIAKPKACTQRCALLVLLTFDSDPHDPEPRK